MQPFYFYTLLNLIKPIYVKRELVVVATAPFLRYNLDNIIANMPVFLANSFFSAFFFAINDSQPETFAAGSVLVQHPETLQSPSHQARKPQA